MKTLISMLLDATGSMQSCKEETIVGFNDYIKGLEGTSDELLFTLVAFNSAEKKTVYNQVEISEVVELTAETYRPTAYTPLYDAIGATIVQVEKALERMEEKPAVLFVILTDGLENFSREYTRKAIMKRIEEKEAEGWTFAYLGANQDAWVVGESISISGQSTHTFDTDRMGQTFTKLGVSTQAYLAAESKPTRAFFT